MCLWLHVNPIYRAGKVLDVSRCCFVPPSWLHVLVTKSFERKLKTTLWPRSTFLSPLASG